MPYQRKRDKYIIMVCNLAPKTSPHIEGGGDVISNNSDIGYLFFHTQAS